MNIKFIAFALSVSFPFVMSSKIALAGFDVVNSYEYSGGSDGLIRTSPSLQSTRMPDSIFIENGQQYRLVKVPVASAYQTSGMISPALIQPAIAVQNNKSRMLAPTNAAYSYNAAMTTSQVVKPPVLLSDDDANKLIKSLNNITFIGKPERSIFTALDSSGSEKKLQKGLDKIVGSRYLVAIYPSVSRVYGNKSISWSKGNIWAASLDKNLDSYNLKAVIDLNNRTLYVSEKTASISPALTSKTSVTPVLSSTFKSAYPTPGHSPFSSDHGAGTTVTPTVASSTTSAVKSSPVVNLQPVIMSSWNALTGSTIKSTVQLWADKQGWRLVWQTDKDYNITAPFTVHGKDSSDVGFMEAMKQAFALYEHARFPFIVKAYPEQRLLYVTSKGKDSDA